MTLNDQDAPYRAPADRTIETVRDLARIPYEPPLDGSDPAQDNVTRASCAASAVMAYAEVTGSDIDTVISDLMGDMQHLLDVLSEWNDGEGLGTIESVVEHGSVHYEAEIRGEM